MKLNLQPYYCEECFIDVILPGDKIHADETGNWLVIGWPGVDGIEFRMKNNAAEKIIYAYYPVEQEHIIIAESRDDLIKKWVNHSIDL
jgi:hypothetical protein